MAGIETVSIPLKYVIVSASQPTTAFEGQIWYDSSTKVSYQFDGTEWLSITPAITEIIQSVLEQSLQILYLQVNATVTPSAYSYIFADVFSDSGGYQNTINTTNTTAFFLTDKYTNSSSVETTDDSNQSATTGNDTNKQGLKFTTKIACTLTKVTKNSSENSTKCYLEDASHNILQTANFVGHEATFSYALSNATSYYVRTDSAGASRTAAYKTTGISYPVVRTNVDFITSDYNGDDINTQWRSIASITTNAIDEPDNLIVETNALSTGSITAYQLVCLDSATAGTGSIDYDIKIGSNAYQTGKSLNTKYSNADSGSTATLKINLKGVGTGNTSEIKNYALLVWS